MIRDRPAIPRYLETRLRSLDGLDWENPESVQGPAAELLDGVAEDREGLRLLLENVLDTPSLLSMCEYDPVLDKIVLHVDRERDLRLRLHVFRPGGPDRPHNHRWSFVTRVLNGGYRHVLFEPENLVREDWPRTLRPLLVQHLRPGASYTLHHGIIHSLDAAPDTVSLVLRGPAAKERMIVMDRSSNELWHHYGASADQTEEHRKHTLMSADHLRGLIEYLVGLGLA